MDDHHIPRTKPNWIIKFLGFFSFASLVGICLYLVCFSFNNHHCFFPLMVTSTLIQVYLSSHLSILLHFCFHDLNFYELKTCLQSNGKESEISFFEKKKKKKITTLANGISPLFFFLENLLLLFTTTTTHPNIFFNP